MSRLMLLSKWCILWIRKVHEWTVRESLPEEILRNLDLFFWDYINILIDGLVELDRWDVKIYKVFNVKGDLEKMHSFATWTTKLTITTIVVRNQLMN